MENYCAYISEELTRKLYDVGMPLPLQAYNGEVSGIHIPFYAQVFDWFLEKGYNICIEGCEEDTNYHPFVMCGQSTFSVKPMGLETWQDAANKAIEKAIELIKEK